jgi:acetylornithine deacetylase/succinyl-diaminopimelate desuccinylase-like protein
LEVVGADGMPPIRAAGNVLRPKTSLKLSMRIPPGIKGDDAKHLLKKLVEENPPYGAKISIEFPFPPSTGWFFSNTSDAVRESLSQASLQFFGKPLGFMLQGVSIPFVSMFTSKFPSAQCIIAGVLGPKSNAHGPNEFLHIGMFLKLTCCLTQLLQDFINMKH